MKRICVLAMACSLVVSGTSCVSSMVNAQAEKGVHGFRYRPAGGQNVITSGGIELTLAKLYSGDFSKDFFACVTVKNVGEKAAVFDSGLVEMVDTASGLTLFSIMKDKDSVTLPSSMPNVLMRPTLQPGQKIRGTVYFQTEREQARGETYRLSYKEGTVQMVGRHPPKAEQLLNSTAAVCDQE